MNVQIRGIKIEDESKVIRIINPNEEVPLPKIKEALNEICEVKSEIYPEQFSANVVLFGGMSNGNFRIKGKFHNPEKEHTKEIVVSGKKIKIAVLGAKRRCYLCSSADHVKAPCPLNQRLMKESEEEEMGKDIKWKLK